MIPETFPHFEGHFPGNPILPAAMIVEISSWLAGMIFPGEGSVVQSVERSKFTHNIAPNDPIQIELTVIGERRFRSRWIRSDGGVAADVRITLG